MIAVSMLQDLNTPIAGSDTSMAPQITITKTEPIEALQVLLSPQEVDTNRYDSVRMNQD